MATKSYELTDTDGWIQVIDGSAVSVVEVRNGNVYLAFSETMPTAFTHDHHRLANWSTIAPEFGPAWVRSQTVKSEIVISTMAGSSTK